VHALLSLHGAVLFACTHPVTGLQLSVVQTSLSLQLSAAPGWQAPPEQVSLVVQTLSSLHGAVLFWCVQPVAGLHPSVVQTLPSLQLDAGPPTQLPPEHVSFVVQALPSLQGSLFGVWTHPLAGLQESVVHGLLSLQTIGVPAQVPLVHLSPEVQALLSLHGVLFGWLPSGGQVLFEPSQTSAMSHCAPVEERQTTPDALTPSAGQLGPEPSQVSATSQRSLAFRHTPLDANPSGGQLMLVPVQVSATSHGPAETRHVAPALPATCLQAWNDESQVSTVHGSWSSQSLAALHCTLMTQSEGEEFGDPEGIEQTSIRTPPAPASAVLRQHVACVSLVRQQSAPAGHDASELHALLIKPGPLKCVGAPTNGSAPNATEHVDRHACPADGPWHRSGRVSLQV
jgi:hypothetical protein